MKDIKYIIDLDGTVYNGTEPIAEAKTFIEYLKIHNRSFVFFTNSAEKPPKDIFNKLEKLNIHVPLETIITSGCIAIDFLHSSTCNKQVKLYVIGSDKYKKRIIDEGFVLAKENEIADYVLVSFDENFGYSHLKQACKHIMGGAELLATNTDPTIPSSEGIVPHTGAIVAAIEVSTGVKARIFGKPSTEAAKTLRKKLGSGNIAVVGDRLDTDMAFAANNNFEPFLILTGITGEEQANKNRDCFSKSFLNLEQLKLYDQEG